MPQITFHGAAETVTGSKYLVTAGEASVLVDCGLFQGLKSLRQKNWQPPPFEPSEVDAVVLTHAHLDHIGYLPRLVKDGFCGPIFCTPATDDLAELLLFDSAKIHEQDAEYANRKGFSRHDPARPLFTATDASRALRLFRQVKRSVWQQMSGPIWIRFHDAGHLLGSNMIEMEIRTGSTPTRLLFSGDIGRYDAPLYHDPTPPPACDYLICESTYGNRNHPEVDVLDQLTETVLSAVRRGGVMLVASFAVGRAQQLIYLLQVLIHQNRIPELPIFLDSPMAINATTIFRDHNEDHDLSEGTLGDPENVLTGRNVHLARTAAESKSINKTIGPAVIISSSGMMTAGRILHHLRRRLPDDRNTVVLAGFMAAGTRGRSLQEGAKTLRIHGRDIAVGAAIETLSGLSGHAGRDELLRWLEPLDAPRQTFLTHGEPASAAALAETLRSERGWEVTVPAMGESFSLDNSSK